MIHQIIGEEYCKKHSVKNPYLFLKGNLSPDLVADKKATHYSVRCRNGTYTKSIENKVNLQLFCDENTIDNNFNKGIFLHLITDQLFFYRYMLDNPKYRAIEDEDQLYIQSILYRDYHRNNNYLMDKHPKALLCMLPEVAKNTRDDIDSMEILSNEAIDEMIEMCSNIDLEYAYNKIREMSQELFLEK